MAWHIIEKTLEGLHTHNTLAGKYWVIFFFIFRFLLLVSIADTIFGDEMGNFECDTNTPGCKNVCFNTFTPISLMRYWSLQILFSALPGIIFITYVDNKIRKVELAGAIRDKHRAAEKDKLKSVKRKHKAAHRGEDKARRRMVREQRKTEGESLSTSQESESISSSLSSDETDSDYYDQENKDIRATNLRSKNMPPRVFLFYELMVILRALFELAFTIGQYFIYPFHFRVPEMWECTHFGRPCLNRHTSCYIARPMEKTIFIGIMYGTSILMVLLSIYELYSMGWRDTLFALRNRSVDITKKYRIQDKDLPAHLRKGESKKKRMMRRVEHLRESLSGSGPDLNGDKYVHV